MVMFSTDQMTRLSCAGPISRLLEHLRMQDPSSAPSDDAAGATGMLGAAALAGDEIEFERW
jgi:hypothetical protein